MAPRKPKSKPILSGVDKEPWKALGISRRTYFRQRSTKEKICGEIVAAEAFAAEAVAQVPSAERLEVIGQRLLVMAGLLLNKAITALPNVNVTTMEDIVQVTQCFATCAKVSSEMEKTWAELRSKIADVRPPGHGGDAPADDRPFAGMLTENFRET